MATQMQLTSFAHIESMVSKPTWKDILLDLIASNRVDPWNLDIVDLADSFISKVREKGLGIGIHFSQEAQLQIKWAKAGTNIIMHSSDFALFWQRLKDDFTAIRLALGEKISAPKEGDDRSVL